MTSAPVPGVTVAPLHDLQRLRSVEELLCRARHGESGDPWFERVHLMREAWRFFAAAVHGCTSRTCPDEPAWTASLLLDLGTATQVRELSDRWRLFKFRQHRDTHSLRAAPTDLVREALASRLLLSMRGGARFCELGATVGVSQRTAERIITANRLVTERDIDPQRSLMRSVERLSSTLLACLGRPLERALETATDPLADPAAAHALRERNEVAGKVGVRITT